MPITTNFAVTSERFTQGLSYQEFLAQAKVNLDRFEQYYQSASVSPNDAAFFKKVVKMPNGAARVVALAEDWCPDVFRGLPQLARICEVSSMELKVFPRDANPDIMNEFLFKGEFQSIPCIIFCTAEMKYLGHWVERPALAYAEQARAREEVAAEMAEATPQDRGRESGQRLLSRWPTWQQAEVMELREILTKALGTY